MRFKCFFCFLISLFFSASLYANWQHDQGNGFSAFKEDVWSHEDPHGLQVPARRNAPPRVPRRKRPSEWDPVVYINPQPGAFPTPGRAYRWWGYQDHELYRPETFYPLWGSHTHGDYCDHLPGHPPYPPRPKLPSSYLPPPRYAPDLEPFFEPLRYSEDPLAVPEDPLFEPPDGMGPTIDVIFELERDEALAQLLETLAYLLDKYTLGSRVTTQNDDGTVYSEICVTGAHSDSFLIRAPQEDVEALSESQLHGP